MTLDRKIIEVATLTQAERDRMFQLMETHYGNTRLEDFERDLKEKEWVLFLTDADTGQIAGFSTQKLIHLEHNGKPIVALFSGDTVIEKDHWGSMALSLCFGELMLKLINKYTESTIYWMLISKGLRTYKYLPIFFLNYYPCHDKETPEDILQLRDTLGYMLFPDSYNKESGIIKAKADGQFLKEDFQAEPKEKKPHEIFFFEKNPGCHEGDELICLAELSMDNLNAFIKRILSKYT